MEKLVSADCLMKKFEVKRPQLGFNGALEVGIINIIPFHLIHNIQDNQSICFQPQKKPGSSVWNKHALGLSFHSQEKNRFYQRYFLECSLGSETNPNEYHSLMSYTSFYN